MENDQTPEQNPDLKQNPYFNAEYFNEYLIGLLSGDTADVSLAAAMLSRLGTPFSESLDDNAQEFKEIRQSNDEVSQQRLEEIYKVALQAYVYSGLEVNAKVVVNTALFLGKKPSWVVKAVRPSRGLLSSEAGIVPRGKRVPYIKMGKAAIGKIKREFKRSGQALPPDDRLTKLSKHRRGL